VLAVAEQLLQAARIMVQEIARDAVVLGVFVVDAADAVLVEQQDFRARIGGRQRR
jgi:hypothetical protein